MDDKSNKQQGSSASIRVIGTVATIIAILLAFYAFVLAGRIAEAQSETADNERRYFECSEAVNDLQLTSDYLTTQARLFVVTGRPEHMQAYVDEVSVNKRRDKAVERLRVNMTASEDVVDALEQALYASDDLAQREMVAMHLAAEHYGLRNEDVPKLVVRAIPEAYSDELDGKEGLDAAMALVLDESYNEAKDTIQARVDASSSALLLHIDADIAQNDNLMQGLLFQLRITVALLLCVVMILVLALFMYVLKPLVHYVQRIRNNKPLVADGAYELHYLANAYNTMYEDNSKRILQLRHLAERDPLTGISNRTGYDSFLATHTRDVALILIDIDNFKEYNKVYGHDTGDAALVKLASALSSAFRSTDFPCRIESDRFAVIMTSMNGSLRDAISNKMELVNSILADETDDLPMISLAIGAAFSAEGMTDKDIYAAAHKALQQAQEIGNHDVFFYGERNDA